MLSAADIHVVVMGYAISGIVHPSKIYNILKLGAPFLFMGPKASFVSRIITDASDELVAISVRHGETSAIVDAINGFINRPVTNRSIASRESGFTRFIAHIEAAGNQQATAAG